MSIVVVARRVFRIGVQTLEREGDRWFVRIRNRTYHSRHPIPEAKVPAWKDALR